MANSSSKLRALFVLAGVLLLALVVNGKQLAGYATGTDEPLPPGCEEGAYVADGNVDANARRAAGSIVPAGECPAHCWCLGINCPDGILNAPECQNCAGGGGGGEDCNPDEDPTCILPGGGGKGGGGGGGGGGSPPFHDCYGFNPEIQCTGGEQGDDGKICICGQWVEDGGNEHALYFICTGLGDALIPLPSIPSSCELICDEVPNDFIDENFPFGLPSELQGLTPRQICLDICNDMCNGNPGCWEGWTSSTTTAVKLRSKVSCRRPTAMTKSNVRWVHPVHPVCAVAKTRSKAGTNSAWHVATNTAMASPGTFANGGVGRQKRTL